MESRGIESKLEMINAENQSEQNALLYQIIVNIKQDIISPSDMFDLLGSNTKLFELATKTNPNAQSWREFFHVRALYNCELIKLKKKHSNEYIYQVVDKNFFIGAGENGHVYMIIGYLTLNHARGTVTFYKKEKAVKVVEVKENTKREDEKTRAIRRNEAMVTKEVDYLHPKNPIILDNFAEFKIFMTMKLIEGHTLTKVHMGPEKNLVMLNGKKTFSAYERIQITINLLKCLKILERKGIQVEDMHAGNIMIDPKTLDSFIIDFGVSRILEIGESRKELGTNLSSLLVNLKYLWTPPNFGFQEDNIKFKDYLKSLNLSDEGINDMIYFFDRRKNKLYNVEAHIQFMQTLKVKHFLDSIEQDNKLLAEKAYKESQYAIEENNKLIASGKLKSNSVVEQASNIIKYAMNIEDNPDCVKTFIEFSCLSAPALATARSKNEMILALHDLSQTSIRIDTKINDLMRIVNLLKACDDLAAHDTRFKYDKFRLDNFIEYISYLLGEKYANITIYHDLSKIENKIDKIIKQIYDEIDYKSEKSLFPFVSQFEPSKTIINKIENLELMLFKEKLMVAINTYEKNSSHFLNYFLSSGAYSDDRKKDIRDFTDIITNANSKKELIENIADRFQQVKRGNLGRSELVSSINKILKQESEMLQDAKKPSHAQYNMK